MKILGIETSCDETAAAILEFKNGGFRVVASAVATSVKLQAKYGGIVPEVAARKQVEFIMPVLEQVLEKAKDKGRGAKGFESVDCIAVTRGPGLITSLRVGVEAARTLSFVWAKPLIGVNHLEGHIYSALLVEQNKIQNPKSKIQNKFQIQNQKFQKMQAIRFPAMALVVSGGHTELVLMKDYNQYRVIGQTVDDAVGEAFDKVAKILNLGYPGGPVIAKMAEGGNKNNYELPRPMINSGDFNFSFSGLKTAVLYKLKTPSNAAGRQNSKLKIKEKQDLCASFQEACVDVLVKKTIRAAEEYKAKTILVGGGVAANRELRGRLSQEVDKFNWTRKGKKRTGAVKLLLPELKMTGDNAAMIALAGYFRTQKHRNTETQKHENWRKIKVDPNLGLRHD